MKILIKTTLLSASLCLLLGSTLTFAAKNSLRGPAVISFKVGKIAPLGSITVKPSDPTPNFLLFPAQYNIQCNVTTTSDNDILVLNLKNSDGGAYPIIALDNIQIDSNVPIAKAGSHILTIKRMTFDNDSYMNFGNNSDESITVSDCQAIAAHEQ